MFDKLKILKWNNFFFYCLKMIYIIKDMVSIEYIKLVNGDNF